MNRLAEILLVTISSSSSVQSLSSQKSDVVNHAFCESSVSAQEMVGKKNLEEVHTYAGKIVLHLLSIEILGSFWDGM